MKRILLSVITIFGVTSAMVVGARAAFSDTEKSTGSVLAAGTIDISVDGQNPWTRVLVTADPDLKPDQSKTATFVVKNEGVNDLVLWKKVEITGHSDGGTALEPELAAETGGAVNDIEKMIHYDMTVGGINTIPEIWGIMMSDINDLWIPLGKIAPSATLDVTQVYKLDKDTGNEYQGDSITFDIELYAEQLHGTGPVHTTRGVVLENKILDSETGFYEYADMDQTWGLLTWDNAGHYTLKAWGLVGTQYQLARWDGTTQFMFGSVVNPIGTNLSFEGDYGFGSYPNSKYWLRDTSGSWPNANALWESNLVH